MAGQRSLTVVTGLVTVETFDYLMNAELSYVCIFFTFLAKWKKGF